MSIVVENAIIRFNIINIRNFIYHLYKSHIKFTYKMYYINVERTSLKHNIITLNL